MNSRIHIFGNRSRIRGSSHFSHARARTVAAVALLAGAASRSATPEIATPARFPSSFAEVVAGLASACATSVHDSAFNSEVCSQGFRERKRVKGGVSGSAEDLLLASEVEAGVNFWVLVHFLESNQAQVQGRSGEVRSHLPSTRRFLVPNSCHLDVGWVSGNQRAGRRCVKPQGSGIWVLQGNARARMLPANLDHLRVGWISRGSYETAWVTPGHDCLCPYKYGHGAAVRPQTDNSLWDGVIRLWCRVAPLLSPWCARGNVPTGVNLNQYPGPGSHIRWHSDNELLFKPQNFPELIVSLSLGNSVEFMVRRRASGNVPSSIRLGHGDVLVMDGLAQSEYEHCTASGLQGLRVNLIYRWVAPVH